MTLNTVFPNPIFPSSFLPCFSSSLPPSILPDRIKCLPTSSTNLQRMWLSQKLFQSTDGLGGLITSKERAKGQFGSKVSQPTLGAARTHAALTTLGHSLQSGGVNLNMKSIQSWAAFTVLSTRALRAPLISCYRSLWVWHLSRVSDFSITYGCSCQLIQLDSLHTTRISKLYFGLDAGGPH